jgi:hypothetical protein
MGFGAAVAPGPSRTGRKRQGPFLTGLYDGLAGIAGGGIIEFEYRIVKQVLPFAAVFVAKVLLSNYSFAYVIEPRLIHLVTDVSQQLHHPPSLPTRSHRRHPNRYNLLPHPSEQELWQRNSVLGPHRDYIPSCSAVSLPSEACHMGVHRCWRCLIGLFCTIPHPASPEISHHNGRPHPTG